MKATELIERLQELVSEYGDQEVNYACAIEGAATVTGVDAYNTIDVEIAKGPDDCEEFYLY